MIFLGAEGGNRVLASNSIGASAFRIFRKSAGGNTFALVATVAKPLVPLRGQLFANGLEWTDRESSSTEARYRVVAIDGAGQEILEYKTIVAVSGSRETAPNSASQPTPKEGAAER